MSKLVFNRNNGSADEYGHLLALNRLMPTGDVIEGMAVVAATSLNMTVIVSAGTARISTGTYPSSYGYFVGIDTTAGSPAGEVATIGTASGSNPRIDTVVEYVDLSVTASSGTANNPNNMLKVAVVAGTPAGSPTAPSNSAIQTAIGASNPFIILADVRVNTSVTSISNSNITDRRSLSAVSRAAATTSTGTIWWQELGRTTLTSTANTLASPTITPTKYLHVLISVINSGAINLSLRFNSDSGNNYAYRLSSPSGETDSTSQSAILFNNGSQPVFATADIVNISAQEKIMVLDMADAGTAGATNLPGRVFMSAKWAGTSSAITDISVVNSAGGTMAIGSEIIVLGHN